jgi:hypothetical protein
MKINICLDIWGTVGGAEIGYKRIATKLPHYEWLFTINVDPSANLVIYSNNHRFYTQAKIHSIPAIQRTTGPRSFSLPQPVDLVAVICSSKKGYEITNHINKHLIYNGVDFDFIKSVQPITCDLLYAPARIGKGQCVEDAIIYAIRNKRNLTVLGAKQHVQENTFDALKKKYPFVNWTGLVTPDIASSYIKGCKTYICPTKVHGVSNAIIEAVANDKEIINLGNVEIPDKKNIDINTTVEKYDAIIKNAL